MAVQRHAGKFIFLLLCCFMSLGFGLQTVQAAETVDDIQVEVRAGNNLPPLVQKRMQASIRAIAEQLMLGQTVADAQLAQAKDAATIQEVFDKVLVGYSVQQVAVQPGVSTLVQVELLPWSDVIQQTEVELTVDGMPPAVERLVRQDMLGVEQVFQQSLDGLPLAATDWTNGVLKRSLQVFMDAHLPEFRADFDMDPAAVTKVHLVVYPRLPVVRTVDLNMRSNTVPNFTLLNHRRLMQEEANQMIGVPVAFLQRHSTAFQQMLAETLDKTADFKAYAMHTKVDLTIGEDVTVMSRSDTTRYRWRLEGWADIHSDKDKNDMTRFRMHVGQNLSSMDELFLLSDFYPQNVRWQWYAGYARQILPHTRLEVRYDFTKHYFVVGAEQELSKRWLLRYEYRWEDQQAELALRYKMHDFLSLEYVRDKHDNWLRLISDF